MCTAIVFYGMVKGWPIVVGFNRDERYTRTASEPALSKGNPQVLSPIDLTSGGTWIGVNSWGLFACLIDSTRARHRGLSSRGVLVHEILRKCANTHDVQELIIKRDPASYSSCFVLAMAGDGARLFTLSGTALGKVTLKHGAHIICDSAAITSKSKRGRWLAKQVAAIGPSQSLEQVKELFIALLSEHSSCRSRWYTTCCHSTLSGTLSSQIVAIDAQGRTGFFFHKDSPPCHHLEYRDFANAALHSRSTDPT